ncbi:MAG: tyrosine-type recombinase/integrase, partial [Myxococcota bacterium]
IFENASVDFEDELGASFQNPANLPSSRRPIKEPSDRHARREQVLSHPQARALLSDDRIPTDRQVFYALTIFTGMRTGETAATTWADWDRTRQPLSGLKIAKTITREGVIVERTKTRVVKFVPVHKSLEEILVVWRQIGWPALFRRQPESTDLICPHMPSKGPNAGKIAVRNHTLIMRGWREDLEQLDIDGDKTPHAMRHSFISLTLRDGASLEVVRKVTHPRPRSIVDVYTHVFWDQLCEEVSKLNLGSFVEQPQ